MKVVVSKQKEVEKLEYPKLKIYKSGLIILFYDSKKGTVVAGDQTYEIGEYSRTWNSIEFKDYTGEVKLSNN